MIVEKFFTWERVWNDIRIRPNLPQLNKTQTYHIHSPSPVEFNWPLGALLGRNEEVTVVVMFDPCTGQLLSIPWVDIITDLECQLPYYYDVKV